MPQRSPIARFLLRYMPEMERAASPPVGVAVGIVASLVATALRLLIDPLVEGVPFVTYFPMLAVASIFGGLWGGVTSLVVDTAISVYLWLPPRGSLELRGSNAFTISAFILSGAVVVAGFWALDEVVAALRRSEQRSAVIAQENAAPFKKPLSAYLVDFLHDCSRYNICRRPQDTTECTPGDFVASLGGAARGEVKFY